MADTLGSELVGTDNCLDHESLFFPLEIEIPFPNFQFLRDEDVYFQTEKCLHDAAKGAKFKILSEKPPLLDIEAVEMLIVRQ